MKVLFISKSNYPDYQSDIVMHGGRSVLGADFIDMNKAWYMYKTESEKLKTTYGRGFTLYGLLDDIEIDRTDILDKIKKKYFDLIIYGSVCYLPHLRDVLKHYNRDEVIFIDGLDGCQLYDCNRKKNPILGKGLYFKRELSCETKDVYPIGFGIPEHLIVDRIPVKTKHLSSVIPNYNQKYSFENQEDYYVEYRNSEFAITQKKGGWDCLRHYEILMNGCIPKFKDLEQCPNLTMNHFPKELVIEANNSDQSKYERYCSELLEYTRNNLTTKSVFNYVFNIFLNLKK